MKASDYFQLVSNSEAWLYRSIGLRAAADRLLETAVTQRSIEETRESFVNDFAYCEACEAAKLLYGLSLETALKGIIVQRNGSSVGVEVEMTGEGKLISVKLRTSGLNPAQGNHLCALARLVAEENRAVSLMLRHVRMTPLLDELSEAVLWRSRYPVSPDPAAKTGNGSFLEDRRLLVRLLDELQKDSVWFRFLGKPGTRLGSERYTRAGLAGCSP